MFNKIKILLISTTIILSQLVSPLDLGSNESQALECKDEIAQIPTKVIQSNETYNTLNTSPPKEEISYSNSSEQTLHFVQNISLKNTEVQNLIKKNTSDIYGLYNNLSTHYDENETSGTRTIIEYLLKYHPEELDFLDTVSIKKIPLAVLKKTYDAYTNQVDNYTDTLITTNKSLQYNFLNYMQARGNYTNQSLTISPQEANDALRMNLASPYKDKKGKTIYVYVKGIDTYTQRIISSGAVPAALLESTLNVNNAKLPGSNAFYCPKKNAENMNTDFAGKSTSEATKFYTKMMRTGLRDNLTTKIFAGDLGQTIFHPNDDLAQFIQSNPKLLKEYILMSLQVNGITMNVGSGFLSSQKFLTLCYELSLLEKAYGTKYKHSLDRAFFLYTHFLATNTGFEKKVQDNFDYTGPEKERFNRKEIQPTITKYKSRIDQSVPGGRRTILTKYILSHIIIPNLEFWLIEWGKHTHYDLSKKYSKEEEVEIMQDFLDYYFEKTNTAQYVNYL